MYYVLVIFVCIHFIAEVAGSSVLTLLEANYFHICIIAIKWKHIRDISTKGMANCLLVIRLLTDVLDQLHWY